MRQTEKVALINGRVHTPLGIVDSLTFEGGRITETGGFQQEGAPDGARVIDLQGRTVLPGFCDSYSSLGQPDSLPRLGITEAWQERPQEGAEGPEVSFENPEALNLPFRLRRLLRFPDVERLKDFLADGWRTGDGTPFCQIGGVLCQDKEMAEIASLSGMQVMADMPRDDGVALLEELKAAWNVPSRHLLRNNGRWENVMKTGSVACAGSDGFGGTTPPLSGIGTAIAEGMSVAEAISLYTWNAAWNGRNERRRGELAVGRDADLVVLDRDPFAVRPEEIAGIEVLLTVCAGCVTHDAGKLG